MPGNRTSWGFTVSEGGLEHANAGNLPGSGKSCGQNTGPLAGGVNPFPETVMDFARGYQRECPYAIGHVLCRAARRRPNTVLAAAYDLKVFFTVVGKPPDQVRPADVLAFITAQRTGACWRARRAAAGGGGRASRAGCRPPRCAGACRSCRGSSRSCRPAGTWRLIRCRGGCRPAGSGPGRARACRWCAPPGGCRGSCPRPRWMR